MDERGRGSLPGLVLVVGLAVFFVADAITGGPNAEPGDPAPVPGSGTPPVDAIPLPSFTLLAGGGLLLLLVAVAVKLTIRRNRRSTLIVAARVADGAGQAASTQASKSPSPRPGSNQYFLMVVDELLAAVDTLQDDHVEQVEEHLLRFAASAASAELTQLLDRPETRMVRNQFRRFVEVTDQMTTPQLRYLTVVIEGRRGLR